MGNMDAVTIAIIAVTVLVSWQGWQNHELFQRLKFHMGAILQGKEYYRMLTSALLHADFMHLFFNLFALFVFAPVVSAHISSIQYLLLYIAAVLLGSLFTILFHSKNLHYSAIGASGGVSGIVFSAIMIYPDMPLVFIFLPFFDFPAWVFGLLYLGYSMFGMNNLRDNLGHAAHLGGSVAGILLTLFWVPDLLNKNTLYVLGMLIPLAAMGVFAYTRRNA
ncbi:MAG: rhomboid family intramembrane serine protease [Weeksellaceae bacterium]|nr:rhomboid family intramembrane serine protease [Weeksellaceae bacterium]